MFLIEVNLKQCFHRLAMQMDITQRLTEVVKDCPDFPRKGILFKDIMPIFHDHELVWDSCQSLVDQVILMLLCDDFSCSDLANCVRLANSHNHFYSDNH